ncbi:HNH endonuclease [Candidatus Saccharibacteria bacterium]|nr:HNH endonuclease [Candidatus Saccharibacteria bacterium]
MHRFITNAPKGMVVDHISGNTLDNRQSNLRVCTNAANIRNGKLRINNSTGVQGVTWDKSRNKWQSRIKVNYKTVHLGRYNSLEEATKARKLAEKKYWSV